MKPIRQLHKPERLDHAERANGATAASLARNQLGIGLPIQDKPATTPNAGWLVRSTPARPCGNTTRNRDRRPSGTKGRRFTSSWAAGGGP